ncbi:MAG TPA: PhnD/SsuA/transferrin family substrate-binding protein [Xanthobacteraceae bacterium]|nr:PhnD/SsuA/transferrin family substrate-binding protein [Xanthobacteraceae bacterium]
MTKPRVKIAIASYGHTKDVKSGAAAIAGVEPDFVEVVPIIGAFRRMVRDLEFDVCEMAPTTYMIARALGAPFIALPIFLMRRFHHGGFVVRPDSGIKQPKDLEGKKVGVRAYSVTTGVWTRGIFVNEYGLDSSKVTWVVDDEEHVTSLKLPSNVVHAPDGKSLASMMANGELQAGFSGPAGIGRAGPPTGAWEQRAQTSSVNYPELIANAPAVEAQWFRRTGIYPIHGLVVVKTAVLAQHPFVAKSLFDAFLKAKDAYVARLKAGEGNGPDDLKYRSLTELVGDPLPYGLKENMPSIEAMLTYGLQQGLIPKRMPMEEVFVDPQPH